MFKKILLYFLLINFINTVLFYNNEGDIYAISVKPLAHFHKGEINSLFEFFLEECFNVEDTSPEDEDDDWLDPFKTEIKDVFYAHEFYLVPFSLNALRGFPLTFPLYFCCISSLPIDIDSPPPEFFS